MNCLQSTEYVCYYGECSAQACMVISTSEMRAAQPFFRIPGFMPMWKNSVPGTKMAVFDCFSYHIFELWNSSFPSALPTCLGNFRLGRSAPDWESPCHGVISKTHKRKPHRAANCWTVVRFAAALTRYLTLHDATPPSATSIKHQASSIKHQASHQASLLLTSCRRMEFSAGAEHRYVSMSRYFKQKQLTAVVD